MEHPFRVIKRQFGFEKTRLHGLAENRFKINVIAALTNLFLARRRLLATASRWDCCAHTSTALALQLPLLQQLPA